MEENRSMSEIKDYNKAIFTNRKIVIDHRFREEIVSGQESCGDGGNLVDEFSWPPRSYTCSFCKKEFRSAQALGGHMNVHRREKAKLRQITPIRYFPFLYPQSQHFSSNFKFLDPNPNINPNITCFASNTSSFPTMLQPLTHSSMSPPLIHRLCHPNYESSNTFRSRKSDIVVDGFDVFSHEKESMDVKKSATSLLVESKFDDLDLELRLGCSEIHFEALS